MNLEALARDWNTLGQQDPLWAVLSDDSKKNGGWNEQEFLATGRSWIDAELAFVRSVAHVNTARAIDFGCGAGRLTQALCRHFDRCDGVDIAPSMLAIADRLNEYPGRCHYHLNPRSDLSIFPDETFDFAYSILVLQHMRPFYALRYLRELLRIVKSDGVLAFQLPADLVPPATAGTVRSMPLGPVPVDARVVEIRLAGGGNELRLVSGQQAELHVDVRNASTTALPGGEGGEGELDVKVAGRWFAHDGDFITDDNATLLGADLPPGQWRRLPLVVTAPERPGRFLLEVDVLQERGGRWQGGGSMSARIEVEVVEADDGPPKIQMHAVPRPRVVAALEAWGGRIVDIRSDELAGRHWTSFTYVVVRDNP